MPTPLTIDDIETLEAIDANIDDAAANPLKVEGDMGKIEEFSLTEQMKYADWRKGVIAARSNPLGGMRIKKIVSPDANGN